MNCLKHAVKIDDNQTSMVITPFLSLRENYVIGLEAPSSIAHWNIFQTPSSWWFRSYNCSVILAPSRANQTVLFCIKVYHQKTQNLCIKSMRLSFFCIEKSSKHAPNSLIKILAKIQIWPSLPRTAKLLLYKNEKSESSYSQWVASNQFLPCRTAPDW